MRTATWYAIQHSAITQPVPMDTCRWLDTQTMQERFTLRAKVDGKWAHLADGTALIFFDDEQDARREIWRLRGNARAEPTRPRRAQRPEPTPAQQPLRIITHRIEG